MPRDMALGLPAGYGVQEKSRIACERLPLQDEIHTHL